MPETIMWTKSRFDHYDIMCILTDAGNQYVVETEAKIGSKALQVNFFGAGNLYVGGLVVA